VRRLRRAGIESPRLEADLLLGHVLGCSRAELLARPERPAPVECAAAFEAALLRRLRREPIQHILGRTEFWSMSFRTDARALVPRPETELLVQGALEFLAGRAGGEPPAIAEIGVGAGAVILALARELPSARLYASDVSCEALALAAENARLHGVRERVRFLEGDLAAPYLQAGLAGRLDLVLSNPPYIPSGDIAGLQPEVREYDPRVALDGGGDGLAIVRRLLKDAAVLLRAGGRMILELGLGQPAAMGGIAAVHGWRVERVLRDHRGIERVVAMRVV